MRWESLLRLTRIFIFFHEIQTEQHDAQCCIGRYILKELLAAITQLLGWGANDFSETICCYAHPNSGNCINHGRPMNLN